MATLSAKGLTVFEGDLSALRALLSKPVEGDGGPTVVVFTTSWCAACRRALGILGQMAGENEKAKFIKVDLDDHYDVAGEFAVYAVPWVKIYRGAQMVNEVIGLDANSWRKFIGAGQR